ncbi:MAG: SPOR domain-containing protein, partial [Limibacillus sp.]
SIFLTNNRQTGFLGDFIVLEYCNRPLRGGLLLAFSVLLSAFLIPGLPEKAKAASYEAQSLDRLCAQELEEGSPRLALILCERRAHMADADALVFRRLGEAYAANGLLMEAKAAFRRAIQLGGDPEDLRRMIATTAEMARATAEPHPAWASPPVEADATPPPPLVISGADGLPQDETEPASAPAPIRAAPAPPSGSGSAEGSALPADGPAEGEERIAVAALPEPQAPAYLPETPVVPEAPASAPQPAEAAAEPASSGAYKVQLASVGDPAVARREAESLKRRFPGLLNGLRFTSETIALEGRGLFHRVQFEGLGSLAGARALCSRFRSLGQDCFVPLSQG